MRAGVPGSEFAVFCGIDVGKTKHHIVGLDASGARLFDKGVDNDEQALGGVFDMLAEHGRVVVVVVDQVSGIAALPLAVAHDMRLAMAYLPGLTMRRLADLYPGRDKTDPRGAFVIADAARTLPHTVRPVDRQETVRAEVAVLTGYDDDLAAEAVRVSDRLRDALLHVHAGLERLLGLRLGRSVFGLLAVASTPAALRGLGEDGMREVLAAVHKATANSLPPKIMRVLDEQTVEVPGTAEFGRVIAALAARLNDLLRERREIAVALRDKLASHRVYEIIRSLPGAGDSSAAKVLVAIGDASQFPSAGHLAAYCGLAPVTRQSGTSIGSARQARRGNLGLKHLFFVMAMTSALFDDRSKAFYQRKRAEGRRRSGALIALARRKVDVLHVMWRTDTTYRSVESAEQPTDAPRFECVGSAASPFRLTSPVVARNGLSFA